MGRWSRTITLAGSRRDARWSVRLSPTEFLTVSVPKAESAKPRQITIMAAGDARLR